jgi:hypothetical protein
MKPVSFPRLGAMCLRAAGNDDTRAVVTAWVNSAVREEPARKRGRLKDRLWPRVIGAVRKCDIVILTSPTHPSVIHGWAAGKNGVLHYVWVARELWGHGLAKALIGELLGTYGSKITTSRPWPWASSRFVLESKEKEKAA